MDPAKVEIKSKSCNDLPNEIKTKKRFHSSECKNDWEFENISNSLNSSLLTQPIIANFLNQNRSPKISNILENLYQNV